MVKRMIYILVDISTSMAGEKIEAVKVSIKSLLEKLRYNLSMVKLLTFPNYVTSIPLPISNYDEKLTLKFTTGDCTNLAKYLNNLLNDNSQISFIVYGDGIGYFSDKCPPQIFNKCSTHTSMCFVFRVGKEPHEEDDLVLLARVLTSNTKIIYRHLDDDITPIALLLNSFIDGSNVSADFDELFYS